MTTVKIGLNSDFREIVDGMLVTGRDLLLFDDYDNADGTYTGFNADCWAKTLDFSGIPWWNDDESAVRHLCGAMITRKHMLAAEHLAEVMTFPFNLHFSLSDGTTEIVQANGYTAIERDLVIIALDAEVSTDVKVYPILPADYEDDLGVLNTLKWPIVSTHKPANGGFRPRISIHRAYIISSLNFFQVQPFNTGPGATDDFPLREEYYLGATSGDSGNPVFLLLPDGNMAVLFAYTSGGGGTFITEYITEVNALLGAYSLDQITFDTRQQTYPVVSVI